MEPRSIREECMNTEIFGYFSAIQALINKATTVFPGEPKSASIDLTFWNMEHLDYNESWYTLYISGYSPSPFQSLEEIDLELNRLEILFRRF